MTSTITRVEPPHPKRFFIHNSDEGCFVRVKGHSVTVPGMEEFDLFVFTDSAGDFRLTEGKTGAKILTRETEEDLIQSAARLYPLMRKRGYKPLPQQIEESIAKFGLSPRWTP